MDDRKRCSLVPDHDSYETYMQQYLHTNESIFTCIKTFGFKCICMMYVRNLRGVNVTYNFVVYLYLPSLSALRDSYLLGNLLDQTLLNIFNN
jgi:hypothetical protein